MTDANSYHGLFDCWLDVQVAFGIDEPEPDDVLLADYYIEISPISCCGRAVVVYRRDFCFYVVTATHNEDENLKGYWLAVEYGSVELLLSDINSWKWGIPFLAAHKSALVEKINQPVPLE